jgi:MFS family permease
MSEPVETRRPFHPDVWWIAFSAFFADLGYQMVIAGLPLFLVLDLGAPAWVFGLATAIAYGPGAFLGYLGGRVADRAGRRRTAIWGNAFIPLLSFTGTAASVPAALALFATGWWARNFRTPARRAMLVEVVQPADRGRAFGLLHALDVGGGLLAALAVVVLVGARVSFGTLFLVTLAPLLASTLCLVRTREAGRAAPRSQAPQPTTASAPPRPEGLRLYRGVIVSAALYGFSSYSLGFPILTVAQGTGRPALGALAYGLFLGVSALVGLAVGSRRHAGGRTLALLGYLVAAAGSGALAVAFHAHAGVAGLYAAVAVLGVALGVIETLEPTLISRVTPEGRTGGGMGSLTAARSVGLLVGNLAMGLLYALGPAYSYAYAAAVAVLAAAILLAASAGRSPIQEASQGMRP